MFIRFVIHNNDPESGRSQGLFQAISDLEHAGSLSHYQQTQYDLVYEWFRHNLKKPRELSRSKKPHTKNVALSWFKDTATEHIAKIREICSILNEHDIETKMIRSEKPGYIVYEDSFQVAAEPFSDTSTG